MDLWPPQSSRPCVCHYRGKGYLYSSEHGPFSDDEINIIEKGRNYGHPLIIGYCDNNYNGYAAAVSERPVLPGPWHTTYPLIMSETANAAKIGANTYRDPIKSFYPASKDLLSNIFKATKEGQENKPEWPAVAPSGMDVYTSSVIPGWKNSLLVTSLKEGRIVRLKLNSRGDGVTGDTLSYFKAKARYRDIALSADGTKLYLATDSSSVTSGPSGEDPHGSSLRGSIIELTWQKVAGTSVEKAERIDRRRPDKALRKGSRSRTLSYKGR